jgi:hypothetical protein
MNYLPTIKEKELVANIKNQELAANIKNQEHVAIVMKKIDQKEDIKRENQKI